MAPTLVLLVVLLALPMLLQGVALAGERRVTARRWLALDEEHQEEARRGYKTAQVLLTADGSSALLSGITLGGRYRAEDEARCSLRGCEPPGLDCQCGFYAFKQRAEAVELLRETIVANGLRDKALLIVDLDGRVLQFERGYRAERQRVMCVQFERDCSSCRREGVGRRATKLAAAAQFRTLRYARFVTPAGAATSGMLPVRPVCDEHVPARGIALGLPDLAGLLGTEVRWLP